MDKFLLYHTSLSSTSREYETECFILTTSWILNLSEGLVIVGLARSNYVTQGNSYAEISGAYTWYPK